MKHLKSPFFLSLVLILVIGININAQDKKPISHSDYDHWKSLSSASITDDGAWIKYVVNPQQGDGALFLHNVKSGNSESFERANAPH